MLRRDFAVVHVALLVHNLILDVGIVMSSSSVFLSTKILQCALAIAFASNLAQLEMYTGACGLTPSSLHVLLLFAGITAFVLVMSMLSNIRTIEREKELLLGLSIAYGLTTFVFAGELSKCDILLIEACVVFTSCSNELWVYKFLIGRVLFGLAYSKFAACGNASETLSSLKSSALNQPFPFTPVWHLAQVPDTLTSFSSLILIVSEILLPVLFLFTESAAIIYGVFGLALFYTCIGNFNWSVLLLIAAAVRVLPPELTTLLAGSTLLKRWGYTNEDSWDESAAETKFITSLVEWAKIIALIIATTGIIHAPIRLLDDLDEHVWRIGGSILAVCLFIRAFYSLRASPKALLILIVGAWLSGGDYVSLATIGFVKHTEDFSGLPTCYTFVENSDIGHTRDGRSVYLFQTRFKQTGTNTVGRNLGGSRYAELSFPGSVHGDEVRPPFLMGHFPRLALKLWRIGTGRPADVVEGIQLCSHLEKVIATGSPAMRVFFSSVEDSVLSSMVGSQNQVQAFAQRYQVTSRAADHQWWKRSQEHVSALPTKHVASPYTLVEDCSVIVPSKILGVPLETILLTAIAVAFVLRIVMSSGKCKTSPVAMRKKKI